MYSRLRADWVEVTFFMRGRSHMGVLGDDDDDDTETGDIGS